MIRFISKSLFSAAFVAVNVLQVIALCKTLAPNDADLAAVLGLAATGMSLIVLVIVGLCRPKRWRWLHDWLIFTVRA